MFSRFVCAQRKETGTIVPLRSYCCKGEDPETATIWQAALATSAATSFFDSVKIGDCTFIDGAMGANNPARELEHEADQIWCEVTGKLEPLVKCFISLGTGNGGINPMTDKAWKFLTKSLTAVATDTRATAQDVAIRWKDHQNTRYFRFNVEQGLQKVGLEEYKRIDLLEAATKDYLNHADTRPRVRSCVENLRTKKCQ
jgi:predicted acylesterase/phospholipase RssA